MNRKFFLLPAVFITILIVEGCKKEHVTPTLKTLEVSEITFTSVKSGGEITDNGGDPVSSRGLCWNTSPKPTANDNSITEGTGSGSFTSMIEGLTPGTTYYMRSWARNSAGVGYGNEVTFSTQSLAVATLTTAPVTDVTFTSASTGGTISNDGGSAVIARGICWSTSENPTIAGNYLAIGNGKGSFVANLSDLSPGTTYYVRAYATNSVGTVYGNQISFSTVAVNLAAISTIAVTDITSGSAVSGGIIENDGGGPVTSRGVCWSTSENPTINNSKTTNGEGTGTFISNITGLASGTTFYLRAYATNSAGTSYGNQVSFSTPAIVPPTLTTTILSGLTPEGVVTGGVVTSTGDGVITVAGVCWSTSENPTISNSSTSDNIVTDHFTSNVSGLSNGTVYYLRAYATNSAGTSYGNQITFITPVADIDGNIYKTVAIGQQIWMAENLKTTRLKDNSPIPNIVANAEWMTQTGPAYSWLNNNISNKDLYGALYNWFTVTTGKLCPDGWHVPADAEFNTLEIFLGTPAAVVNNWGSRGTDQGTQMKATTTWNDGGNGTNSSGFNVLSGGYRQGADGSFPGLGIYTYFWSSTDDGMNGHPNVAWYRRLDSTDPRVYKATTVKTGGKYIRCLKD